MFDARRTRDPEPRWATLYAAVGLLLTLVGVVDIAVPTTMARRALEGVGILVLFGAMAVWVRCNRAALALCGSRAAGEVSPPVPADVD